MVYTSMHGTPEQLIACHECDLLMERVASNAGSKAFCLGCGSLLYMHIPTSLNRSLALYLSALFLFIISNTFPFLSLDLGGGVVNHILLS